MKAKIQIIVLILILMPLPVWASFISLATSFDIADRDGKLTLNVSAENKGDEAAHDVQFEVYVAAKRLISSATPVLGVYQTATSEFVIEAVFGLAGRYPIVLKTYYKDANGYQFSALSTGFHDHKHAVISDISISAEETDLPVSGTGKIDFVMRNSGKKEHAVELQLYLPNELSVTKDNILLNIGPKETRGISFDVENFSALEDSSYLVSLVAQYENGEEHLSSAGTTIINVTGDYRVIGWSAWIGVAAVSLLLAIIVTIRLRRRQIV